MTNKQAGFTLVELITVIIVLGILAATVLPRLINLRNESMIASMQGLNATIASAITLTYAKAIANRLDNLPSAVININGDNIELKYGYPSGNANGLTKLITAPSDDWKQRASSISGAWVYWHGVINEDAGSANCYVRYRESTNIGQRPIIDFVSSGCPTAE